MQSIKYNTTHAQNLFRKTIISNDWTDAAIVLNMKRVHFLSTIHAVLMHEHYGELTYSNTVWYDKHTVQ